MADSRTPKEVDAVPRYATVFINRACPRACSYCRSRLVKVERLLKPNEWIGAFDVLRSEGIKFFLILGNEVLTYPWIVELVKMLKENGFYGMYAMYTTFPEPWYSRLREKLVEAGLYNISAGVDVLRETHDRHVTEKSIWGLEQLMWFKSAGVPDVHATVTIHEYSYRHMHEICGLATKHGIWVAASMVEYSHDGLHDFFGAKEELAPFLVKDSEEFRRYMYWFADMVRRGTWMVQTPPEYFELLGDVGGNPTGAHCTLPLIISVEADGRLRLCAYRPFYRRRATVFDVGKTVSMEDYAKWHSEESKMCPGCLWSFWYLAEYWHERDVDFGDRAIQVHASKYWVRR